MEPAQALQAAALAAREEAAQQAALNDVADDTAKPAQGISLAQRLVPFLAMLDRCQAAKVDVVWSV